MVACTIEMSATLPTYHKCPGSGLISYLSIPKSVTIKSGTLLILVKNGQGFGTQ
jgi:hypothetical protein